MFQQICVLLLAISTVLALPFPTTSALALQQGEMEWSKTYGGSDRDFGNEIIQKDDGGFLVIGTSFLSGQSADALLVETDANGEVVWMQDYGTSQLDAANSIITTSDGGIAIIGHTRTLFAGTFQGSTDFWLVKAIKNGVRWDPQWSRAYGSEKEDIAYSAVETATGGFALAGFTEDGGIGGRDALIVETNNNGDVVWMQTYGTSNDEMVYSLIRTIDGGYAFAGYMAESYDDQVWLVKTNVHWEMEWMTTIGMSRGDNERAHAVIQADDESFVLAGYTTSSQGAGGKDFFLVKISSNGQPIWKQTYGGTNDDSARSVVQTADKGFAIAGVSESFGPGYKDFWIVKTDANGDEQWTRGYGDSEKNDVGASLLKTADGGFVIVGHTYLSGAGSFTTEQADMRVVKIEPDPATTTSGGVFTPFQPVHTVTIGLTPATPVITPFVTVITGSSLNFTVVPTQPATTTGGLIPGTTVTFEPSPGITITETIPPETTMTPETSITASEPAITTTPETTPATSEGPVTVTVTNTETETESDPQVPGFMSLPALLGLIVVMVFRRRRK